MEVEERAMTAVIVQEDLIKRFEEDCRLRTLTDETFRRYVSSVRVYSDFLVQKEHQILNPDISALKDFLGYLRFERRVKAKTIENHFSGVSAFYDYLLYSEQVTTNIVPPFRKRYLRRYKEEDEEVEKRVLTVEEMGRLVHSILDPRDKAIAVLLAKTGVRRGELLRMDVDDINWTDYSIILKPARKRSNKTVFFDDEAALVLRRWIKVREALNPETGALFVSYQSGNRFDRNGMYVAMTKYAERLGFHNSQSVKEQDHFSPHHFRHWFTTWLLRNNMPREMVKELRGDKRKREAIDIYQHLDRDELRRVYLACIPKLGL
jgi:integrase/recombinase XerD